jgi:hypothetical protein
VQAHNRVALAAYHNHFAALCVLNNFIIADFKALSDGGNGYSEHRVVNFNLHALNNRQRQRNFNYKCCAVTCFAFNRQRAAAFLDIIAHNVHSDASAAEFRNHVVSREAGEQNHILNFTLGVFARRLHQKPVGFGFA